jgi:hypothetical protein
VERDDGYIGIFVIERERGFDLEIHLQLLLSGHDQLA